MKRIYSKVHKCKTCGEERPEKFPPGAKSTCEACKQKQYRNNRGDHLHSYYQEWYKKHGRNRADSYAEKILEWQEEHPDRVNAAQKLRYALRVRKVKKADSCQDCKRTTRLSAHHEDYSNPLEVVWLCSSCHKLRHIKKPLDIA
jgi:hypothetical protein